MGYFTPQDSIRSFPQTKLYDIDIPENKFFSGWFLKNAMQKAVT